MKAFPSSVAVGLLALACIGPASAQERIYYTQAGRPIVILQAFFCGPRGTVEDATGTARYGRVSRRHAFANACGNPRQPVMQLIYVPNPGFRGQDEATVYVGGLTASRRIIVR